MHQTLRITAYGQHTSHQFLPADVTLADMLILYTRGLAHLLRPLANALAQGLSKARVVEDPDGTRKKARHPTRVARAGQRSRHDDPVVARKVSRVPFSQCVSVS